MLSIQKKNVMFLFYIQNSTLKFKIKIQLGDYIQYYIFIN